MPRLRRVAGLCSSTLSDTANRLRKTRKKKSSVVPPVSQRSHVGNLRQIRKQGKGRSSKRKENRRLSFLFAPAAGAALPRRPQAANPTLRFSEKHPARQGRTRLRQFECPAGSVQRKVPPGQGEHANAVRAPRSAGAEKAAAPFGRTACAVRVPHLTLRSYLTILRRQSMLSQQKNRRKYEPVHPCALRPVPRH